MKRKHIILLIFVSVFIALGSFKKSDLSKNYVSYYNQKLASFKQSQMALLASIEKGNIRSPGDIEKIRVQINLTRIQMKAVDFWFRYLEPVSYKKINGPLVTEWETEVFEKFEKPYKRDGAGLTLAALYLEEDNINKDSLLYLIRSSVKAAEVFGSDSITEHLKAHDHFYLCNRLFLLNLAAIYTTGFECPDTARIIPELKQMLTETFNTYLNFNENFRETTLPENYLSLYTEAISFVAKQQNNYLQFDHFTFIKKYVNPLFSLNQKLIKDYNVVSKSNNDYSLNRNGSSIFSKDLYRAQNTKGIFLRVNDKETLAEIDKLGKLFFYDPLLSGNNLRSCASCHNPTQFFTDTLVASALQFDGKKSLPRNTPSLINTEYNHLLMLDGKHTSLQNQTKDVLTNALEMGSSEEELLKKILSCSDYKSSLKKLLKHTPQEKEITIEHISSAITLYYSKFSHYYSEFDKSMNHSQTISNEAVRGFNIFMGKAQCGTCHFVPQFNGVKPPYVSSEFEVLGVPEDSSFNQLSSDKGRSVVNPAAEMLGAFRTGSIRNAGKTRPYMHNGSLHNLNQVIDFYNAGGGSGKGLKLNNQTLSGDSLHLTKNDERYLLAFINSLNEEIEFDKPPEKLPASKVKMLNKRKVGGEY